ncbi:MAG: hypothetical protein GY852_04310 [bacterium]|nr:hypothetical protein [bacterium]
MGFDAYLEVIAITIMALIGYLAIITMAAYALKRPQLAAYARIEGQQLFLSVAIIFVAFGAWHFTSMVTEELAGGDPMELSIHFLNIIINEGILPIYLKLVRMEVLLSYFNAVEYRMGPGVWNWITKAAPGIDPLLSVIRMLIFTFTALYGTLSVQVIILYLIDAVAYYYLLPAGIVLRFFPPTRDAGVYLIVLAIAFQCFFPLLYSINFIALTDMWQLHGWATDYTPDIESTNYFMSINGKIGALSSNLDTFFSSWALPIFQPLAFPALLPFLDRVAQISLVGLVLPALTMTLTIAFVNAITKFVSGKG